MPEKRVITCDICGAEGRRYRTFFWLKNANEGLVQGVEGHPYAAESAPRELVLDTAHTVSSGNWVGPNPNCVHLCPEHYEKLHAACEQWLTEATEAELIKT